MAKGHKRGGPASLARQYVILRSLSRTAHTPSLPPPPSRFPLPSIQSPPPFGKFTGNPNSLSLLVGGEINARASTHGGRKKMLRRSSGSDGQTLKPSFLPALPSPKRSRRNSSRSKKNPFRKKGRYSFEKKESFIIHCFKLACRLIPFHPPPLFRLLGKFLPPHFHPGEISSELASCGGSLPRRSGLGVNKRHTAAGVNSALASASMPSSRGRF